MPAVLVEVCRSYDAETEVAIMDAVHEALVATFSVPETGRNVRFAEYAPHRMTRAADDPEAALYTRVTIDCFPGRTDETKRALYAQLAANLEPFGVPQSALDVLVRESDRINWG